MWILPRVLLVSLGVLIVELGAGLKSYLEIMYVNPYVDFVLNCSWWYDTPPISLTLAIQALKLHKCLWIPNFLKMRLCGHSKASRCWWAHIHCHFLKSKMRCWNLKLTFQIQFFWKCIIFPFLCFLFPHLLVFSTLFEFLKSFVFFINCYFFSNVFFSLFFLPFLIYFHFVPWRMWSCLCKHIFFLFSLKKGSLVVENHHNYWLLKSENFSN
jgi:hypothetical protein